MIFGMMSPGVHSMRKENRVSSPHLITSTEHIYNIISGTYRAYPSSGVGGNVLTHTISSVSGSSEYQ